LELKVYIFLFGEEAEELKVHIFLFGEEAEVK